MREPTLICQALATLDELTDGRVECVYSIGNFGLLAQYGMDWTKMHSFSRVKEAHHVMRTFLDNGAITFDGDYYKYAGLFTFARPVQEHLPIIIGAMRGPKSFELAGEVSDGVHHAAQLLEGGLRVPRRAHDDRARRRPAAMSPTSTSAHGWPSPSGPTRPRPSARPGAWWSSTSRRCRASRSSATGSTPTASPGSSTAMGAGDIPGALDALPDGVADQLSVAGTPEECVAKLRTIADTGVNHMILCVTDPILVRPSPAATWTSPTSRASSR